VSCAQCQRALRRVRAARRALALAAGALAAGALLAGAAALCLAVGGGSGGGGSGAAAAGLVDRLGAAALGLLSWVAGVTPAGGAAPPPAAAGGAALRAAALGGGAAALGWLSAGLLGGLEARFLKGEYPPMRNTDKS
jgi:hypothetical protein